MELQRLQGRKICDYVLRRGKVWKGKTMMIRFIKGAPRHPNINPEENVVYLGTFASTKLHKSAVKRNRMRRRCREALRTYIQNADKLSTMQLLVSPRSSSLSCDFGDIKDDVAHFFS